MSSRSIRRLLLIASISILLSFPGACLFDDDDDHKECFDPNDPCPNDMFEDDLGCLRDRCAGEVFWGERIPCFWDGTVAWWTLVGEGGRYLAYVVGLSEEEGGGTPIWLYDLETGEKRMFTEPGRYCDRLRSDGNRLIWFEEAEELEIGPNASDIYVKDVITEEEWQIPNPERRRIDAHSIGGDHVAYIERSYILCNGYTPWYQIWLYNLSSGERTMVADSYSEEDSRYKVLTPEVADGKVAYFRQGGLCGEDHFSQLRVYDIESGEDTLFKEWSYNLSLDNFSWYEFRFDGRWLVYNDSSRFHAHLIDGSREVEGPLCPYGGCLLYLSDGKVAYAIENEDDLIQMQIYIFDLETEQVQRLTDLRPYFDRGGPERFHDGRLLWGEIRGRTLSDDCGNVHEGYGGVMLFWKDIEF